MYLDKSQGILITGGSGFIGTNLMQELIKRGYDNLLNIDIAPPLEKSQAALWKKCDILDYDEIIEKLSDFKWSVIIHLAAETALREDCDMNFYSANIQGVENIVRLIKSQKHRVYSIFTSTMLVNDSGNSLLPTTQYGRSKAIGERIVHEADIDNYCIVRPTSIWGEWFREPYLNFFMLICRSRYIRIGGKRSSTKTFGYVGNVTDQFIGILNSQDVITNGEKIYLGDEIPLNIDVFALEISRIWGVKYVPKAPYQVFRTAAFIGDLIVKLGVNFPLTTFRLRNMTLDRIENVSFAVSLQSRKIGLRQAITNTLKWMENTNKFK